ncbi:Cupredoxin [Amylocarpus encephaloides]|uniref:Cupredoxin n=1 Tax=Amylocarpus encephaloides TaxID=45428 RepID=A0A9P7YNA9_9HELO|nr:Cupredoxin [Amylocarpus encephaloides]
MRFKSFTSIGWGALISSTLHQRAIAQADYPELPPSYLTTGNPVTPLPQGYPWGQKTANNTNPYQDPPITGVIRRYDFTITRGRKAPDGYLKEMLLINGQFPAPLIEANWGDTIQVTVRNKITTPREGVALHWHGILQKASQWMDGVPGVSQCPIPPGGTFTYSFLADLYGSSWYHSHYSAQYSAGLVGPLIIHGPDTVRYDIDKGPILLTDHYHTPYLKVVAQVVSQNINQVAPLSDSNLINGKNNFNCSSKPANDTTPCRSNARLETFRFSPGKVHRLRLINAGAEGTQKFSLDGHDMKVIANDFVPIIPYDTKVVTLGIGQRTDVLVTGLKNYSGAYIMRSSIDAPCSLSLNPDATAIVYYKHDDLLKNRINGSTPWPEFLASKNVCENDPLNQTVPWFPMKPDPSPPTTETIDITFGQNSTGFWQWFMNGSSFRANFNQPILLLAKTGSTSFPTHPEWNVHNMGGNSSFRIIINNNGPPLPHPIHLHGHNMFVLASGPGTWDGKIVNPNNPQRRDVHILPAGGHMVLQVTADNPGAWPLHCHIAWHVSAGLYVTVLERPKDIQKLPIPAIMAQTCRDWTAFTNTTIVDQIDSGL